MIRHMIAQIRGNVLDIAEKGIVIDTGAIGYFVYTPMVCSIGDAVTVFTHLVIREDAHELYGFATQEEKGLFMHLISVSGVGPKTALHMLTLYPIDELVGAIQTGDARAISLVPGIGKKTAEKIIIDLKDKLIKFSTKSNTSSELVEALLSLGFKEHDIRSFLSQIDTTLSLEKQITTALQLLKK